MLKLRNTLVILSIAWLLIGCEESDTTPPQIAITSPTNMSSASEIVHISCIATDNDATASVELWIEGVKSDQVDKSAPYEFDLDVSKYIEDDTYSIVLRAYDESRNYTDSEKIEILIQNHLAIPVACNIDFISYDEGILQIKWEKSSDADFKAYRLEHSLDSDMLSGISTLTEFTDIDSATYYQVGLDPQITHYYRITVIDTFDLFNQGEISEFTYILPIEETAFELLSAYMLDNNLDADIIISGWIIPASAVSGNESNYFILDIRSESKYAEGHIPGAVHSNYADVLTTVEAENTNNLPVVVAGYSGMSEAFAVVALRLSGYSDAKVLKWGMSSWHSSLDSWSGNIGNIAIGHSNWSTTNAPAVTYLNDQPEIVTDLNDPAAILAERVDAILAGFKGVTGEVVLQAPENYQVECFWSLADYEYYGHLTNAYQVTPGSLTIGDGTLSQLDPSQTIVSYCWTGQTTSMLTAWLTALGYDAKVLKFGVNGLIYDLLESHKWVALENDLPLE